MRTFPTTVLLIVIALLAAPAAAADWEVRPTGDAALVISCRQAPVVKAQYVFWGPNWKWAGASLKLTRFNDRGQLFSGKVAALDLTIEGTIASPAANQLRYTWNLEAARDLSGIIGGGLEFRLGLDSPALGKDKSDPELLPDSKGWKWAVGGGRGIAVQFDKPLANVYFERGNQGQIRAMFLGEKLPRGRHTISMTVTLPEGGQVAKTLAQRYGQVDTSKWHAGAMRHDASPVDLSFLNHKPAGKLGPVRAEGDRLVFGDGSEARFWGGNIAAYSIFAEKEQIETQTRRIARLGYNLMRIHHHDSMGWVGRTVIDKTRDDSQHLDPEVMDRLDYWIKCLRDQGVYVWLDLHVGRLFKPGDKIGDG